MDKRLLTIQDISCVGQCSLTVALPLISACGIETGILPSSVLSNHTAGFSGWTFCDLADDMPLILDRWKKENIDFDAFYTGYVTRSQIPHIIEIMEQVARPGAIRIIDPVLGDYGKMYAGFDENFPNDMKKLIKGSDVILPNMTEACLLLGIPYVGSDYDQAFVEKTVKELRNLGTKNVVLTGVSFEEGKVGVACYDGEKIEYYFTEYIGGPQHGTGDIFASVFSGSLMRGKSILEAASIAADFIVETIKLSIDDKDHWYGVKFEKAIPYLVSRF